MELLPPIASLALPASLALLLAWLGLRISRQGAETARRAQAAESLDTVAAWPPSGVRVLTIAERQAYDLLKRAMPGFMVLAQVPLSRFVRVPTHHAYADWMVRVGALNADLLLCDGGSRVLAVIDIRAVNETARVRKRHERMARVLKAAGIHVQAWREDELPSAASVRQSLAGLLAPPAAGMKLSSSRPMPLIPVADIHEILAQGDQAAAQAAQDAMEPVPSAFFEELEPATRSR